jgi:c-di-GMP-binding flagellar brake protein YcgR
MVDSVKMLKLREQIEIVEQIDDELVILKSTIIDVNVDKNIFYIYNPIYKNRIYTISKGKKNEFRYSDDKMGIYSFEGKILRRYKEKSLYILEIKLLGNGKKVQRREFFRIDLIKSVVINEPIDEKFKNSIKMMEQKKRIKFNLEKYALKDISGGGFGFYSNKKFEMGTILIASLNLGSHDVDILVEIVRIIDIKHVQGRYLIGANYLHLTSQKRSIIINFIFDRQRQLRQKGLI